MKSALNNSDSFKPGRWADLFYGGQIQPPPIRPASPRAVSSESANRFPKSALITRRSTFHIYVVFELLIKGWNISDLIKGTHQPSDNAENLVSSVQQTLCDIPLCDREQLAPTGIPGHLYCPCVQANDPPFG